MASVVAVCVSEKKGEQKRPLAKVYAKRNHGIIGDAHSGNWHRQISILARESVEKLEKKINKPLMAGDFAENILIRGLELHTLPIGEILKVGDTICSISQIGKECHHGCAIRQVAGDCVMPREGIFVEVLQSGEIKADDRVELLWEECVNFHGHSCGGLLIGYKAALYAMEILEGTKAPDEEIVCVAENDACGIDAIQYILGCTMGKGNLKLDIQGKQAFTFYSRNTSKGFRIMLREDGKTKGNMKYLPGRELFDLEWLDTNIPDKAPIYKSQRCESCGEMTAEPYLRVKENKKICLRCAED